MNRNKELGIRNEGREDQKGGLRRPYSLFLIPYSSPRGFTLIEMVIYVAILSGFFIVVVGSLLKMTSAYTRLRDEQNIQNGGITAIDRMVREIRDAESITTAASTFNAHPGRLTLQTTDVVGAARTVEFYVENGALKMKENSIAQGALTRADVTVTDFTVRHATTTISDAVKIELTLQAGTSTAIRTKKFYNTVILRNSY